MYTSDCRTCSYLLLSPSAAVFCPRCNSADNCSPPTPIYVRPQRPHYYVSREVELANALHNRDMEQAINESFEESMVPRPHPASEATRRAMQGTTVVGEYGFMRECGICLDVMKPGEGPVVVTPCCHHYMHQACMEKTLDVIPHCPFCRWFASS